MNTEKIHHWIYLIGVAGAVLFWCFTMYGLPPRVDRLEERVREHDKKLAESTVKIDIILDDVKTIKNHILDFRARSD